MSYNRQIAEHWDSFINWRQREEIEGKWLCGLLRTYKPCPILDVATGTGFHAITLAKHGFFVEAWDKSVPMLKIARCNALAAGVSVKFERRAWLVKHCVEANMFSAVICLGNSFSHLLSSKHRKQALMRWHSLLSDNGILVLDVRNFHTLATSRHTQQPFCYHGGGLIGFTLPSKRRINLNYKFGNGYAFSLSYACLTPSDIANEALASGYALIDIYGNGKRQFDPINVDFYQMTFRKQKT